MNCNFFLKKISRRKVHLALCLEPTCKLSFSLLLKRFVEAKMRRPQGGLRGRCLHLRGCVAIYLREVTVPFVMSQRASIIAHLYVQCICICTIYLSGISIFKPSKFRLDGSLTFYICCSSLPDIVVNYSLSCLNISAILSPISTLSSDF